MTPDAMCAVLSRVTNRKAIKMWLQWDEDEESVHHATYKGITIKANYNALFGGYIFSVDDVVQSYALKELSDVETAAVSIIDSLPPHG